MCRVFQLVPLFSTYIHLYCNSIEEPGKNDKHSWCVKLYSPTERYYYSENVLCRSDAVLKKWEEDATTPPPHSHGTLLHEPLTHSVNQKKMKQSLGLTIHSSCQFSVTTHHGGALLSKLDIFTSLQEYLSTTSSLLIFHQHNYLTSKHCSNMNPAIRLVPEPLRLKIRALLIHSKCDKSSKANTKTN